MLSYFIEELNLYFQGMKLKLLLCLSATFILFTVIGTLSHEAGHYIVAKFKGYKPAIHYGYTSFGNDPHDNEMVSMGKNFSEKEYDRFVTLSERDFFLITLAGPLQTILTGTAGFILLIIYRKQIIGSASLNFRQWLLIFFSLFWLRQVANAIAGVALKLPAHGMQSDETTMAEYLHWSVNSLSYTAAVAGLIISLFVIFKFIPANQRATFILSGFVGGISGFILWLYILGPILMP